MNNYSESFEKAYAAIDEFNRKNCFPGGKSQAQRIVDSYRYLLQNDDLEESKIFELQKAIGVRIIMGFDNERIKITLDIFYSDIVSKDQQDPLLAFVRTSLTKPNVTLVPQKHDTEPALVSAVDPEKRGVDMQEKYQFESLSEFLAYVPISQAKGVSVAWVEGKDYRENFDKGYKLLDERRYLEAIPVYTKCLAVNPVAYRARLELTTCYTMIGQYSKAHEQVNALAQFKMPSSILASFYRRYGYLLAEEGKNLASYACYQYSLGFESSDVARSEIKYLSSIMGKDLSIYDPEEILKKNGIPVMQSMPEFNTGEVSDK